VLHKIQLSYPWYSARSCERQGNWNKEIIILKTLRETAPSEAEWIMWVDIDTLFADMTVVPRFDEYDGYDLVVWGDRAKLMEGDLNAGAIVAKAEG